jgi:hypothetical protein
MRHGQWQQPGSSLHLTGPELAVKAYLARIGLACNLERIMIRRGPEIGGTFDQPVRDFKAQLEPCKIEVEGSEDVKEK